MLVRWIAGGFLVAVGLLTVSGCVMTVEQPMTTVAIEGNVLDRVTDRGVRLAEVHVTVHLGDTKLTGKANTSGAGHFVVRATGPAASAGDAELMAVDLVVRGKGYWELQQTIPAHLILESGPVLVLPDVTLNRKAPW